MKNEGMSENFEVRTEHCPRCSFPLSISKLNRSPIRNHRAFRNCPRNVGEFVGIFILRTMTKKFLVNQISRIWFRASKTARLGNLGILKIDFVGFTTKGFINRFVVWNLAIRISFRFHHRVHWRLSVVLTWIAGHWLIFADSQILLFQLEFCRMYHRICKIVNRVGSGGESPIGL